MTSAIKWIDDESNGNFVVLWFVLRLVDVRTCMSLSISIYQSLSLSQSIIHCLSVSILFIYLCLRPSLYLCLYLCLFLCLSLALSLNIYRYLYPFPYIYLSLYLYHFLYSLLHLSTSPFFKNSPLFLYFWILRKPSTIDFFLLRDSKILEQGSSTLALGATRTWKNVKMRMDM